MKRVIGLCVLGGALFAAVPGVRLLLVAEAQPPARAPVSVPAHVAPPPPPMQPVPYSHRIHVAQGLACEACHTQPTTNATVGLPGADTCMACHRSVAVEAPGVRALAQLAATDAALDWVRVYEVLPGVTWSHAPHRAAGLDCAVCHGDVAASDAMTVTTAVTAMATCIGCHEAQSASVACETCHAWPLH